MQRTSYFHLYCAAVCYTPKTTINKKKVKIKPHHHIFFQPNKHRTLKTHLHSLFLLLYTGTTQYSKQQSITNVLCEPFFTRCNFAFRFNKQYGLIHFLTL